MKEQLSRPNHEIAPAPRTFERFATLDKVGRYIALGRFFVALAAATSFWSISNAGSLLLFGCLFCVPVPTAFDLSLSSGRLIRKVTARSFFTLPTLRRIMEVRYEACTDDYQSMEFLREEVEVSTAVMEECGGLGIDSTEVIAILPTKVNDFNMEQTSTKYFEKINGRWIDATSSS